MRKIQLLFTCLIFLSTTCSLFAQKPKPPIMGWSSWNHFRVHINEQMIKEQADALVSSGLYDAGYRYINIDDGYFGGRDSSGKLFADAKKFPSGMGALADYIHGKGLKAGIYTEPVKIAAAPSTIKTPIISGQGYTVMWSRTATFFSKSGSMTF